MLFADLKTGARLHYITMNSKGHNEVNVPVIALHGMLGTAELHLQATMVWLVSRGYSAIGPTMRGYGESTPKPRDFPLNFYHRDADDILAFMDVLGIEKAHILGYSDGGEIALICAGKQPERFQSVAVWGAVGYFSDAIRPIVQQMIPATWITEEELELHDIPNANAFAASWVRAATYMIDSGGDVSVSLADRISCPVLMMLGKNDSLNPAAYAQVFLEKVQDGALEMFDCGHAIHDEKPKEFRSVLGNFLKYSSNSICA